MVNRNWWSFVRSAAASDRRKSSADKSDRDSVRRFVLMTNSSVLGAELTDKTSTSSD